jgi:hypothetical protein
MWDHIHQSINLNKAVHKEGISRPAGYFTLKYQDSPVTFTLFFCNLYHCMGNLSAPPLTDLSDETKKRQGRSTLPL